MPSLAGEKSGKEDKDCSSGREKGLQQQQQRQYYEELKGLQQRQRKMIAAAAAALLTWELYLSRAFTPTKQPFQAFCASTPLPLRSGRRLGDGG